MQHIPSFNSQKTENWELYKWKVQVTQAVLSVCPNQGVKIS